MPYQMDPVTGKYKHISGSSNNSAKSKVIKGNPAATSKQIKGTTDNKTEDNSNDVFGRGTAKGNCRLRKYTRATISGLGKSFEGTYFISEVTHTVSTNGYQVDFSIKTKQSNIGKSGSGSGSSKKSTPSAKAGRQPSKPSSGSGSSGGMHMDPVTGKWSKVKKKLTKKK